MLILISLSVILEKMADKESDLSDQIERRIKELMLEMNSKLSEKIDQNTNNISQILNTTGTSGDVFYLYLYLSLVLGFITISVGLVTGNIQTYMSIRINFWAEASLRKQRL